MEFSRFGSILGLFALLVVFTSSGMAWFETYDFRRDIQDNNSSSLILPVQESDIDGNGVNETFYGQSGNIYFDSETDFAFADNSGQRCGFQTSPQMKSNCRNLDTGLVSYYTFDNSEAWDAINGENGSLNGVNTGAEGRIGDAYSFEGDDRISDTFTVPINEDVTVSYWVKAGSQADGPVLHSWTGSNAYGVVTGISDRWGDSPSGSISFGLRYDNGNANLVYTDQSFADNEWHHVVGLKPDGATARDLEIFVDGQKVSTSYTSNRDDGTGELPGYDVNIGNNAYDNNYLDGDVDSIRIYERSLSSDEISAIYQSAGGKVPRPYFSEMQGGVYSTDPRPRDSSVVRYNDSLSQIDVSATFNDIYSQGGYLQFYNSTGSLLNNVSVRDRANASATLDYNFQPSEEYSWRVKATSTDSSVNSTETTFSFFTGEDFTNYSYYRSSVNHPGGNTDKTILPFNSSDIDGNGEQELFYGEKSRLYFDNETKFVFADKNRLCGFQTVPEKISRCDLSETDMEFYFPFDNNNAWNPLEASNVTIKGNVSTGREGKIGNSHFFNGSEYLALNRSYSGMIEEFSVVAWIKIPQDGGGWSVLDFDRSEYFNAVAGIPNSDNNNEGDYIGFHSTDSTGSTSDMWSDTKVRDNRWHHVAWVYNGTHKKILIDGKLDKTQQIDGIGTGATRYGFIGDGSEASKFDGERNTEYYEGFIDDLRFYDKAIRSEKVETLFGMNQTSQRPYFSGLKKGSIAPLICDLNTPDLCTSNQKHSISGETYNIDSDFQSRSTSIFEAFNSPASISVNRKARISGLWKGAFDLQAESITLQAGASFRPVNGRIKIG